MNRESQAAPTTCWPLWNVSTGCCSPAYSALDWWAALGPPTPARGGTSRLRVMEKSPRPAEQRQVTDACCPHALTVGPAPGTVSVGDTTADPDRHRPRPAQPPPHRQSPASGWHPLSPCLFKTSFPGGTHHPPHSPQSRVPTETLIPACNPRANNGPAPVPPWVCGFVAGQTQSSRQRTNSRAPALPSGASPASAAQSLLGLQSHREPRLGRESPGPEWEVGPKVGGTLCPALPGRCRPPGDQH